MATVSERVEPNHHGATGKVVAVRQVITHLHVVDDGSIGLRAGCDSPFG